MTNIVFFAADSTVKEKPKALLLTVDVVDADRAILCGTPCQIECCSITRHVLPPVGQGGMAIIRGKVDPEKDEIRARLPLFLVGRKFSSTPLPPSDSAFTQMADRRDGDLRGFFLDPISWGVMIVDILVIVDDVINIVYTVSRITR